MYPSHIVSYYFENKCIDISNTCLILKKVFTSPHHFLYSKQTHMIIESKKYDNNTYESVT